jgi:hypothetical protein
MEEGRSISYVIPGKTEASLPSTSRIQSPGVRDIPLISSGRAAQISIQGTVMIAAMTETETATLAMIAAGVTEATMIGGWIVTVEAFAEM